MTDGVVLLRIQHLGKYSEKEMTAIEAASLSTTEGHLWQIFFNHIGEDSTHSFPCINLLILRIKVCCCPAMFSMLLCGGFC